MWVNCWHPEMYSIPRGYLSTQSRFYTHHINWRVSTNCIYQDQRKSLSGLNQLHDMAQGYLLHSESGNVLTSLQGDTPRERSYWKSQLRTALCGWSKNEFAVWLQMWQKGTWLVSFRTRTACSRDESSQTFTDFFFGVKLLEACWCEKLMWLSNPSVVKSYIPHSRVRCNRIHHSEQWRVRNMFLVNSVQSTV